MELWLAISNLIGFYFLFFIYLFIFFMQIFISFWDNSNLGTTLSLLNVK